MDVLSGRYAKTKEIVDDPRCIFGNGPSTMLQWDKPESVTHHL
jgi:hypothetical protein